MVNNFIRSRTFPGGYKFKGFSGQAQDKLISLEIPSRVIIPLTQGFGISLEPQVKVGDTVYAGQIIGRDDSSISTPVHSSINGKVMDVKKMNYFSREVSMVIIEGDGSEDYKRIEGYSSQWEKLSAKEIEALLYKSGVTSLDRQGIPTHFKTSVISPEEVEDLIVHWAGSEVYNLSLDVLLDGKNLFNFIQGIKILKKIIPQARIHLALNKRKKVIIERIKKLTSHLDKFKIYPVVSKYPQGYDEILIPTLLNKEFPYGYSAANIGIVVLNIRAVLHIFEAVAEGKPLIERMMVLCGPCFKENIHIKVRVGSPLEFILKGRMKNMSCRVVSQSLLTGFALKDHSLPVDRTFSQIIAIPENNEREFLAFIRSGSKRDSYSRTFFSSYLKTTKTLDTNLHGEERACIQCGYCAEVCPVRIIPSLLNRYIRLGINERLMRYGIFNCIDCNLCSYVCPSKISLAENLKNAKEKLVEIGCDNYICILPRFNLKGFEEYKGLKIIR
ncbi:4Fe-4S dicluster domain-containing protein [Candidatus Pacearchaeota archaeon]|nr:4Fe-4S dicluster domain-containing protein [Candidatus Pacearchaeota archaeon]